MLARRCHAATTRAWTPLLASSSFLHARRSYIVLAIESSCDDATVALIDRKPSGPPVLIEHVKDSLDNTAAGGIIPLDARNHHQAVLAPMVRDLMIRHNISKPDLLCVTRGPGMIGSLSAGYNLGKGLAVAWDIPFVGVHHMLGHLLTPRFFQNQDIPQYPFVSLLVSGGHTMLVLSTSTTQHKVLANTLDIAIGDMLDKCARELGITGSMIAREMEAFIAADPDPKTTALSVPKALQFPNPLQNKQGRTGILAYSFAGFITSLRTFLEKFFPGTARASDLPLEARRELARRMQNAIFTHVVTKSKKALENAFETGLIQTGTGRPLDFVCAGGVASNMTLRSLLVTKLQDKFPPNSIKYHFPPPKWCTDNALMIGWAGIELWETARLQTDLSALPTAKWPIEEVLDIDGWVPRSEQENKN
ncbi:uncharacterized protein SAPINGB_P000046 [Magnusiomyces paraingens]|uniref:N(6)-L-threonylcarbamoyladenine synthase n=1 Tax=Magnusiomyces paraingens TaxID=2606893 RepID=A0A5E8AWK9_9ASCO|nr:uncharacterized protein SAPINGB_P000046 [Saprochaete ingens]VVT43573.1 unnamed protein product [Saprochaete ingens]